MQNIILQIQDVYKSFGSVRALKKVNLNIYKGRVMGLIGENGAGKSTIIKCITGIYKMDSGTIFLNGNQITFKNINDSQRSGIAVVHQELQLVNYLSVAENIFLGCLPKKWGIINWKKTFDDADNILITLNVSFKSNKLISQLTIAEQQMVEIAKALSMNSKIIILDEPTDSLSKTETNVLFKTIKILQQKGVSFLYVTHRMKEIHEICQEITIFRDGELIEEVVVATTPLQNMIKKMIGRNLSKQFPKPLNKVYNDKLFELTLFSHKFVKNITLHINKGEILGLAGLIGSGRTEFAKSVVGALKKETGTIFKNKVALKIKSVGQSIALKIFYVTENRKFDGLDLNASIKDNMVIANLGNMRNKIWAISPKKLKTSVLAKEQELHIKMNDMNDPVLSLSGGNQQKILLGKALMCHPELLILDEPTRGVDVGARREIYQIIREICASGTSILMISSELQEIIGMSNRIGVFHEGSLFGTLDKKMFSEAHIMQLATGIRRNNE